MRTNCRICLFAFMIGDREVDLIDCVYFDDMVMPSEHKTCEAFVHGRKYLDKHRVEIVEGKKCS